MSADIPMTPVAVRSIPPDPPSSLSKLNLSRLPVGLDEPGSAHGGITVQPPTAPALESATLPQPEPFLNGTHRPVLDDIPPASAEIPLYPSPGSGTGSTNISPLTRHPLTRPLSPDLPSRDALYLFSNFASYMRSPNEGAEGIMSNEDFKDTVRLLDYARVLREQPNSNVHVLHLKYRFQSPLDGRTATYGAPGDRHNRDGRGRLRNPVPQPFSVAKDAVLKVDYQENGVFDPLPAQAIFDHITKACVPPPRLIVVSFVNSIVTQNHIAQLSTWALTSSPPCYIFSPLETRLRVTLPLQVALHHAIPMSMYAQPDPGPSPYKPSPTRSTGAGETSRVPSPATSSLGGPLKRRHSEQSLPQVQVVSVSSPRERVYPRDPIASLTIISTPARDPNAPEPIPTPPASATAAAATQSDRLPLWALAPGMNVLQGSTSASIGIKLGDFSALNLANGDHDSIDSLGKALVGQRSRSRLTHHAGQVWIDSSPLRQSTKKSMLPPVEPVSRPSTPASRIIDETSDARSTRSQHQQQHLTPPERFTPPNLFTPRARGSGSTASGVSLGGAATGTGASFPRLARIPHWKRGRKEQPEDVLEDLSKGLEVEGVLEGMRNLGMWDLEHTLHADRARRASEDAGGALLEGLKMSSGA